MSEQIATNSESVTMRDEARFTLDALGCDWNVTVTAWSDGTHTVDAYRIIHPPIPLDGGVLDDYEIDLGTDVPTVARVIEAIDDAVDARVDAAWESYLSSYYGG